MSGKNMTEKPYPSDPAELFVAMVVRNVRNGMRQGELLGLKWEDIDLKTGTLHVQRTLSTAMGEGFSFNAPKTVKSRRSTKIPKLALRALLRHRTAQLKERMKRAGRWEDHDLVFTTEVGTPIARGDLITRSFKPLLRQAGCHTCVSTTCGIPARPSY